MHRDGHMDEDDGYIDVKRVGHRAWHRDENRDGNRSEQCLSGSACIIYVKKVL